MNCENCGKQHDGAYASGRFCSKGCSKGFATKANRKEINERISKTLKETTDQRFTEATFIEKVLKLNGAGWKTSKIKEKLFGFGLKKKKCENCKLVEWMGGGIPLELHHRNGDNKDNRLNNLQILCPNCHSLTSNYAGRGRKSLKK